MSEEEKKTRGERIATTIFFVFIVGCLVVGLGMFVLDLANKLPSDEECAELSAYNNTTLVTESMYNRVVELHQYCYHNETGWHSGSTLNISDIDMHEVLYEYPRMV